MIWDLTAGSCIMHWPKLRGGRQEWGGGHKFETSMRTAEMVEKTCMQSTESKSPAVHSLWLSHLPHNPHRLHETSHSHSSTHSAILEMKPRLLPPSMAVRLSSTFSGL